MRQAKFRNGRVVVKRDEMAEDSADVTLHELAQLRTRFMAIETPDDEKIDIAEQYDALVDQLPEGIQMFHEGMVAGDVVE